MTSPAREGLISVILPAFNAAEYLSDAAGSILQQDYEHLELILINDGSSDDTSEIAQRLAASDSRVMLVEHENRGLISCLNEGLELARGEYIARMDADDLSRPSRFSRQLQFLNEHELDLCGSGIAYCGDKSGQRYYPERDHDLRFGMIFWGRSFAHPTVFARKSVFDRFRYEQKFKHAEDSALWLKLLSLADSRFGNCPEILLDYRQHEQQVTRNHLQQQNDLRLDMLEDAFSVMGFDCSDAELELHLKLRCKQKLSNLDDLAEYGDFLQRMHSFFTSRWGASPLFAQKWLECCRINSHLGSGVVGQLDRPALGGGTGFWQKQRLRLQCVLA